MNKVVLEGWGSGYAGLYKGKVNTASNLKYALGFQVAVLNHPFLFGLLAMATPSGLEV